MSSSRYRPFVPAGLGDSRSPCPALNALANHSYLPHDGRDLSFFTLVQVMRSVYNVSYPLALLLTVVGFVWCGHRTGSGLSTRLALDLHDLAKHNHIEHDGSLSHADAVPHDALFAPAVPDHARIAQLLGAGGARVAVPASNYTDEPEKNASGTQTKIMRGLTLFDLCRMRFLRDSALAQPLNTIHAAIARGEIALIMLTFGAPYPTPSSVAGSGPEDETTTDSDIMKGKDESGAVVRCDWLEQWFGEERLPEGWSGPRTQLGLVRAAGIASVVQKEVSRLRQFM